MRHMTAMDGNPTLAAAYGRYIHACASLERYIEFALSRLTPTTDAMATVIFAKNSARRNVDILHGIALLADVELSDEDRTNVAALAKEVGEAINDRNLIIHNVIVEGENGYMMIRHGKSDDGTFAEPISAKDLDDKTLKIASLSARLMDVPFVEYDLTKWGREFRRYRVQTSGKDHKPQR